MNLVVIPAQSAAEPHSHRGFESAVYLMKGRVDVRYGPHLQERLTLEEGDFLFIPADMPHQPINHASEPALAIVALFVAVLNGARPAAHRFAAPYQWCSLVTTRRRILDH